MTAADDPGVRAFLEAVAAANGRVVASNPVPERIHECGTCGDRSRSCRFEVACACWYGVPCDPPGASIREMQLRAARDA